MNRQLRQASLDSSHSPDPIDAYYARVGAFLDRSLADRGDAPWWEALVDRLAPGRVVELGCGTGRITRHLAGDGRRIVGVDRAPAMLARARERLRSVPGVRLVRGDIRALPIRRLPRPERNGRRGTGLVAAPGDPFVHLTGDGERQAALDGAARLLGPGDRLVLELMWWTPARADAARSGDGLGKEHTAADLTIRERWRLHEDGHTLDAHYTYHGPSGTATASFRGRRWTLPELHDRLARAGLEAASLGGGWDGRAFDPEDADVLLVEARPHEDRGRRP